MQETLESDPAEWPPPEVTLLEEARARGETLAPARVAEFVKARLANQPKAMHAILEDARVFAAYRMVPMKDASLKTRVLTALRLCWETDAFLSLACYRVRVRLKQVGVPILPRLLHHVSMAWGQVCIGDYVLIEPGIYIAHGSIVIDGLVNVGSGVVLAPWVGIGLDVGRLGAPCIAPGSFLGAGSLLLGPIRIGANSQVAANSVVVHDVPAGVTVAGAPARVIGPSRLQVKTKRTPP